MRIGVLTGGGDCPGLNAVIRAVVRKGIEVYGHEIIGFRDGWRGPLQGLMTPLGLADVEHILPLGGTILRTSRTNPYRNGGAEQVKRTLTEHDVDALIAIGGEDTLGVASRLSEDGLFVVGVPTTIDNDLSATDYAVDLLLHPVIMDHDRSVSWICKASPPEYIYESAKIVRAGSLVSSAKRKTREASLNVWASAWLGQRLRHPILLRRFPNFDLNTSDGRKLARMLAAQDAGDPDLIQELTRRKKKQDAEQGKVNGGKRTYGRGLPIGTNPASGKEVLDYYALVPSEVVILLASNPYRRYFRLTSLRPYVIFWWQ